MKKILTYILLLLKNISLCIGVLVGTLAVIAALTWITVKIWWLSGLLTKITLYFIAILFIGWLFYETYEECKEKVS